MRLPELVYALLGWAQLRGSFLVSLGVFGFDGPVWARLDWAEPGCSVLHWAGIGSWNWLGLNEGG